jgi:putative tricarboxylic transport membrane protein
MKKKSLILLTVLVLFLMAACGNSQSANGEFTLDRNVEFVVPYGAGGGSDLYARIASDIMQKENLVEKPIVVVNKTGGGGAVGDAYTASQNGKGEVLTTYVSAQITGPMINKTEGTYKVLTPIANLAMDEYTLGVLSSSPYTDLDTFLKAAKDNPGKITVGGSGKGTEDELVTGLLAQHADVTFEYVSFNSSAEVMSSMLGGHIDSGIFNPNECISQVNAGEVRLLGAFGPERISMLPDVATFKEAGFDEVIFQQFRGVFGPPEMPDGAVDYWVDVLQKVVETERWKTEYLEENGLTARFMSGDEYVSFLEEEANKYEETLRSIGAVE